MIGSSRTSSEGTSALATSLFGELRGNDEEVIGQDGQSHEEFEAYGPSCPRARGQDLGTDCERS